jgi:hypothetical protein
MSGLFLALHQYEGYRLGYQRYDLHGNPVLCTHLSAFNRFICLEIEGKHSDFSKTEMDIDEINAELMYQYSQHLYARLDLRAKDISVCIYELCDFISDTWITHYSKTERETEVLLDCLRVNLLEVRRLRLLHRHLSQVASSHHIISGPMDSPDDHQHQLRLFVPERPIAAEEDYDDWVVLSKHKIGLRVLLRGEKSGKPVSLAVPQMVMNHLQKGDKLPLTIGEAWDGQRFVLTAGMPTY